MNMACASTKNYLYFHSLSSSCSECYSLQTSGSIKPTPNSQNFVLLLLLSSYLSSPWWGWFKDFGLHIRRQVGIDGEDQELCNFGAQATAAILQHLAAGFNFFLPTENRESGTRQVHHQTQNGTGEDKLRRPTWPVRKTRMSPRGCVTWICSTDTTQASK